MAIYSPQSRRGCSSASVVILWFAMLCLLLLGAAPPSSMVAAEPPSPKDRKGKSDDPKAPPFTRNFELEKLYPPFEEYIPPTSQRNKKDNGIAGEKDVGHQQTAADGQNGDGGGRRGSAGNSTLLEGWNERKRLRVGGRALAVYYNSETQRLIFLKPPSYYNPLFGQSDDAMRVTSTSIIYCYEARLKMQSDGNLVLYRTNSFSCFGGSATFYAVWSSGTQWRGRMPSRAVMQSDGNFVIYDYDNKAVWASDTYYGPNFNKNYVVLRYKSTNSLWLEIVTDDGRYNYNEFPIVKTLY